MADATLVNGQITDAITQANVTALGNSPAMALGNLFQASAHAFGLMMENATSAQQQMAITAQAATTQGVAILYQTTGGPR